MDDATTDTESIDTLPLPRFNVFQALLTHPELVYDFVCHLDVTEFVLLYSLSRPFHDLVNAKLTTSINGNARTRAPESARIFPFRFYSTLCQYDPGLTPNEELQQSQNKLQVRDVASFRWLRMITFREETVDSILLWMAEAGHLLPVSASATIKKIWFLMDLPENSARIGLVHNVKLWTNKDLMLATMFFIKLDMCCTDPMDGGAKPVIRRLLMAQPSLSTTKLALQRHILRDFYDFTQMFVEWRGFLEPPATGWTAFGMPLTAVGSLQYEGLISSPSRQKLLRPDELVMKEGIRRGLRMNRWYLDLMLWGNVDDKTSEDICPPSRRKERGEGEAAEGSGEQIRHGDKHNQEAICR